MSLRIISFLCVVLLIGSVFGQFEAGDWSKFNSIIRDWELDVVLSVGPKEIEFTLGIFILKLVADIDPNAVCRKLKIMGESGGDVTLASRELPGVVNINGVDNAKVYEVEFTLNKLQFECDISLVVLLDGTGGVDLSNFNGGDEKGTLTFITNTSVVKQKVLMYSQDFVTKPPFFAQRGGCTGDPKHLDYSGLDLGSVGVLGINYDITELVVGEINNDPTLVFNDITNELCKIAGQIADAVSDAIMNNPLSDTSSDIYVDNPFVANDEGDITALDLEESIYEQGLNVGIEMLDLTNRSDLLVKIVIPDDENADPILNTVFGFFSEGTDGIDPFLSFLDENLNLHITENDGNVIDLDLFTVLDGSIFGNVTNGETEPVDLSFELFVEPLEGVTVSLEGDITRLDLDIFPKKAGPDGVVPNILPVFEALGKHTLMVPGIDVNNIHLDGDMSIRLVADNPGIPGDPLLQYPFHIEINEVFSPQVDWTGFVAHVGLLLALSYDDLWQLNLGPLLEELINCLLSTFVVTPRVTGVTVQHTNIDLHLNQFEDAIFVLVARLIEHLDFPFQSAIPKALEYLAAESLTNQELLDPTECPLADTALDNWARFPYNFDEGIFKDISDVADEDLLNELFEFGGDIEETSIFLFGNAAGTGEGLGLSFTVPPFEGYVQDLDFRLRSLQIDGLIPPVFNEAELLNVTNTSEYYPQLLHNFLDVGSESQRVKMIMKLELITSEPRFAEGSVPNAYPQEMFPLTNFLTVEFSANRLVALIDLYMKYSQYDIDSLELENLINIGCWVSRLEYPGGVADLNIDLLGMKTRTVCDPCNSPVMQEIAQLIRDETTWPEMQDFINDLLDGVANLVMNLFSEEEFANTIEVTAEICRTNDFSISLGDFHPASHHTEFSTLVPLMLAFGAAIFIPILVALLLNNCGPQLKKHDRHKETHHLNKEIVSAKLDERSSLDFEDVDHTHLVKSLATNPLIPLWIRIAIPAILLTNFVLFLLGDTGNSVQIDVIAQIMHVPINFQNFQTLSVITSVFELWKSGGYLLAFLLFTLSVAWPYVKLFFLVVCWFVPPRWLSNTRRGNTIEMLDFLGRFSFAEFHFLVFVLVVFQLEGGSPDYFFLPAEKIFEIRLDILPLLSLFTFALAIVVSILVSNVMLVYQHFIEDEVRNKIRDIKLKKLEETKKEQGLTAHAVDEDQFKFSLANWDFTVLDRHEKTDVIYNYTYSLTPLAVGSAAFSVVFATAFLVMASVYDSLHVRIYGFVGYLIEFSGNEKEFELSVFELLLRVYEAYQGNFIIYFVGVVFILTIVIIPLVQTVLLLILLFKPVSVAGARKLAETHHIISVWCCVDVFILAVTLTILELPTVAEGLVSAIPECEIIGQLMENVFLPMGWVTERDVESSCLSMETDISQGAYVAVVAVLFLNIVNFLVSRMFHFYIIDRERIVEMTEEYNELSSATNNNIKKWHSRLKQIGFIRLTKRSKQDFTVDVKNEESLYPARDEAGDDTNQRSSPNPMLASALPPSVKMAKARKAEEKKMEKKKAEQDLKNIAPDTRLKAQLQAFFEKVDPGKLHLVDQLAKEAVSRSDGLYRLNQKLMDKYGATISLGF